MTIWNTETEQILETMWKEGKSDQVIAHRLSQVTGKPVSRNTCIGKRHRMGLLHDQPARPGRRGRKPTKRAAFADGAVERRLRAGKREPYQPPVRRRRRKAPLPCHKGLTFDELTPGTCRWPEGEGESMTFCGCKATQGSYCEAHNRIGHAGTYRPEEDAEGVREAA